MKKRFALMSALVLMITLAQAQERTPRTNARQATQRARIAEGRQSGEVTPGESAVLRAEQRHIRRSERRAKADGDVTLSERRRLERKQDRASRHIRRAKTNKLDTN